MVGGPVAPNTYLFDIFIHLFTNVHCILFYFVGLILITKQMSSHTAVIPTILLPNWMDLYQTVKLTGSLTLWQLNQNNHSPDFNSTLKFIIESNES